MFVGIGRSVVALNRATGEQVWATRLKGYDFVNVALEGGSIVAACCGEIFCLDPLKGFGIGLATIATDDGGRSGLTAVLAEKQRRDQAAVDGESVHRTAGGGRKDDDYWRDLQFQSLGWKVRRFWVYELREDLPKCVTRVRADIVD